MKTVVAHLTASRFFGGPERQMLELAKALPTEIRSVFVSFSETGLCRAFIEKVRQDGFEAIALRHDTPRLLAALRELVGVLRRTRADVVCCHGYKSNLLGLLAARRIGIPVISVSHGWTGQCPRVRIYEALDRRVLRWMDKVVCVSEAQAAKARRAGVPSSLCMAICDAVSPERFANPDPAYRDQLRRMFLGTAPDTIVGAAGRLSPEKGFGVLIDAAAKVLGAGAGKGDRSILCAAPGGPFRQNGPVPFSGAQGSGINVGFVLFGDGPLRESLARQIAARGLEDKFILAGFHSDLDHFLPHLDLFVQSSFTEGLPNVVLESYAAGVPVVATAVGGTPEIIEDRVTGRLVPPADPFALAGGITAILCNDSDRRNMGTLGRQRILSRFVFSTQAANYSRLFEEYSHIREERTC